ncbi:Protein-L-isoaspartate O-methyltransferase [compost metagenome]
MFARLVQLAGIRETDRVLDHGAGNGYSTAVLAGLAREVIALDSDPAMAQAARTTLRDLGIANVEIRAGDISAQHFNTFDAIIIEGAVDEVPDALIRLLAPNGRLVCIVRQGPTGIASLSTRTSTGVVTRSSFNATLPLLEQAAAPEVFVF